MRFSRSFLLSLVLALPLAGCDELTGLVAGGPDAPSHLTYQLIPSGDPASPSGVLLMWEIPRSGRASAFNVYGRANGGAWQLRATTTSPTFHDAGVPDDQYYVATCDENGEELGNSNTVTIDRRAALPAPQALSSISLNGAIQLFWANNAVSSPAGAFDHYRVYSTSYDGTRGVCTANWALEGSTVSDAFLSGNLANGTTRCFTVSAVSHDGRESTWSDARIDTPRHDARNAVVYSTTARRDSAGFLFLDETTRTIGRVSSAARTDLDVIVERRADGTLWFAPGRSGVTMTLYAPTPVADLTSIDRAGSTGYSATALEAAPGYGYVFRLQKGDGVHFAAARVAFMTDSYVVFDWSYQSAAGNAELSRTPRAP